MDIGAWSADQPYFYNPQLWSPSPPPPASSAPHFSTTSNFSEQKFVIYNWPHPKPKSFPDLSPANRKWKEQVDATGSDISEFDDGADDDWCDFAGDQDLYPATAHDLMRAIASTFVTRAKRAFRRGSTWRDFEEAEKALDSEASVKAESDLKRRALLQKEVLNNALRLAVFDKLKARLCTEIWLEEYGQPTQAYDSGVDGLGPSGARGGAMRSKSKRKSKGK